MIDQRHFQAHHCVPVKRGVSKDRQGHSTQRTELQCRAWFGMLLVAGRTSVTLHSVTLIQAVYPANYRSPRTRANSRELERTRANSAELRRTFAGVRRTFAGVRRTSPGFARVRAHSAANSRTVRQNIRSPKEIYPPLTVVRRERSSRRT